MQADGPGTPDMVVRETMGVLFQKVANLDNSVSFWSHMVVIKIQNYGTWRYKRVFVKCILHTRIFLRHCVTFMKIPLTLMMRLGDL